MERLIKRVYWDSCSFLGLINRESDKHRDSKDVWDLAVRKELQIITSFFTFAEVFKAKCEGKARPLQESEEAKIVSFFASDLILAVPVDRRTAELSRKLMRTHDECKKPTDGVHLATAILMNVDEMHTYDGSDLLVLDGKLARADGTMLKICPPSVDEPELALAAPDKHDPEDGEEDKD